MDEDPRAFFVQIHDPAVGFFVSSSPITSGSISIFAITIHENGVGPNLVSSCHTDF
jgi:hypothetical protein